MAETIPAPLKGKIAIVTGGSRGIGAATVKALAQHGCTHIATTYMANKAKAENVLAAVREIHPSIKTFTLPADTRDPAFGKKVVEQSLQGLGVDHIDIMVSNATLEDLENIQSAADLTHEKYTEWQTGTAWAPISLATAVIGHMPSGGRIIMISSVSSKMAMGDPFIPYAAGKAAMEAASKQLAAVYGPKNGVTVNTISVGPTDTDAMTATTDLMGGEAVRQFMAESSLLKRIASPEEIAGIIAFVASPQAGWITGNAVPANGGMLAMLQG